MGTFDLTLSTRSRSRRTTDKMRLEIVVLLVVLVAVASAASFQKDDKAVFKNAATAKSFVEDSAKMRAKRRGWRIGSRTSTENKLESESRRERNESRRERNENTMEFWNNKNWRAT